MGTFCFSMKKQNVPLDGTSERMDLSWFLSAGEVYVNEYE